MKKFFKGFVFVVILGFLLLLLPPVRQVVLRVFEKSGMWFKSQLVQTSSFELLGYPIATELSGHYVATLHAVNAGTPQKKILALEGINIASIGAPKFLGASEGCQEIPVPVVTPYQKVFVSETGSCQMKLPLTFSTEGLAILRVLSFVPDQEYSDANTMLQIHVGDPAVEITPPAVSGGSFGGGDYFYAVRPYDHSDVLETKRTMSCSASGFQTKLSIPNPPAEISNVVASGSSISFTIKNPVVNTLLDTASKVNFQVKCEIYSDDTTPLSERDPNPIVTKDIVFQFLPQGQEPPVPLPYTLKDSDLEINQGSFGEVAYKKTTVDLNTVHYDFLLNFWDRKNDDFRLSLDVPKNIRENFQVNPCASVLQISRYGELPDLEAQLYNNQFGCTLRLNPAFTFAADPSRKSYDMPQKVSMNIKNPNDEKEFRNYTFTVHADFPTYKNPLLQPISHPSASPGGWNWNN